MSENRFEYLNDPIVQLRAAMWREVAHAEQMRMVLAKRLTRLETRTGQDFADDCSTEKSEAVGEGKYTCRFCGVLEGRGITHEGFVSDWDVCRKEVDVEDWLSWRVFLEKMDKSRSKVR